MWARWQYCCQARSAGRRSVAGATKDLIRDGETGFAMDFADSVAVADKVSWILENSTEAAGIGKAGRTFIEENATLKESATRFVDAITLAISPNFRNNEDAAI